MRSPGGMIAQHVLHGRASRALTTPMALLELKNLHVALEDGTEIVKGVDLAVDTNQIHAIMGPNGSGKSTLAYALMGHPAYEITEGQILFDGEDVTEARSRRARAEAGSSWPSSTRMRSRA